ncbi:MAG TPA: cyclic peptide export ABC transporter [Thermoanaerobaculia bacterium]|nr:cyclic peptide export ABC transporter [Thermoanaerobaculia bacterium]
MNLLALEFRRSPVLLTMAVLVGIASGAASAWLLALINRAVVAPERADWSFFTAFFILGLCVSGLRFLSMYVLSKLGQSVLLDLRLDLARKILGTPLRKLEEVGTSRLLTVLTDDLNYVSAGVVLVPGTLANIAVVVSCMVYLAFLSPPLFGILLGLFVLGVVTYQLPIWLGHKRFLEARRLQETLVDDLRGLLHGIKELKVHLGRRLSFLGGLEQTARQQMEANLSSARIFGVGLAWGNLLFFALVAGLLAIGGQFGLAGNLISYTLVLLYMLSPLQVIMDSMPMFGRIRVSLDRAAQLGLDLSKLAEPIEARPEARGAWRELKLEGVHHVYHENGSGGDGFALGPVDLSFKPGEVVFITGGNGSGKTSLAKLLVGLYDPDQGQVLIDGQVSAGRERERLQSLFSVVFADFHLFRQLHGVDATDLENRSKELLAMLALDSKVSIEDGKLSTLELSQGQKKRLALLAAYLEDRQIYLLDEWAADQDPSFRHFFYFQLLSDLKQRGKTVLAITHDDQYYRVADRIIRLDEGRVSYDGDVDGFFAWQERLGPGGLGRWTVREGHAQEA